MEMRGSGVNLEVLLLSVESKSFYVEQTQT